MRDCNGGSVVQSHAVEVAAIFEIDLGKVYVKPVALVVPHHMPRVEANALDHPSLFHEHLQRSGDVNSRHDAQPRHSSPLRNL